MSELPDLIPITGTLSEMIEAAENGDRLAAKELLPSLAHLVSMENFNDITDEPYPVPPAVRNYLAAALHRMAFEGKPGDVAFNLKRRGGAHWTIDDKKLAAHTVNEIHLNNGISIEEASHLAVDNHGELEVPLIRQIAAEGIAELNQAKAEMVNLRAEDFPSAERIRSAVRRLQKAENSQWANFFRRLPNADDLKKWHSKYYGRASSKSVKKVK